MTSNGLHPRPRLAVSRIPVRRSLPAIDATPAMDARTEVLIETIGEAGFVVQNGVSHGQHVVEAVSERTGERFVVRAPRLCDAAVQIARQVGIEAEDR